MNIVLERFIFRHHSEEEAERARTYYDDLDPEVCRDYDANLVEFGLLTEDEFNATYPEKPFVPEEDYESPKID
jgi:hypothetical protein